MPAFEKYFCQQSRVKRHCLLFVCVLKCHTRNSLSEGTKTFSKKNAFPKRYQDENRVLLENSLLFVTRQVKAVLSVT